MGLFSSKKKVIKTKKPSRRSSRDYDDDGYDNYGSSSGDDYLSEFKEGISEITAMFNEDTGKSSEKFAQLSIALANFNQYRNSTFDDLVKSGMSESRADRELRSVIKDAGICTMITDIINHREKKKRRRRS